ncbi:protein kinase domain-containing protein [Thalassoroseus pseudoceratinae]|uniref:protein kinase domain-containing protein n=1 Tax=Thalassoroseus pseudoceratinae TaxID=2713176 RepID=UPI00141E229A|nr:protein kinase [Thalassoroseus pseudoceratinae]
MTSQREKLSTTWSLSGLLVRLYAALCEATPTPPDLPAFLEEHASVPDPQKVDVLFFDQYYHWRFGGGRKCEWYLEHFPQIVATKQVATELIVEEFEYRQETNSPPTLDEYAERFPELSQAIRELLAQRHPNDRFAIAAGWIRQLFHGGGLTQTRFDNSLGSINRTLPHELTQLAPTKTTSESDPDSFLTEYGADADASSPFASLSPDVLRLIESDMHEAVFDPGEYLMREGDAGDSLMVLMDGKVEVRIPTVQKTPHVIAEVEGRQIFGEMSLLTQEPRKADVLACTPSRVMVLPAIAFHNLAKDHPAISNVMTALIAQRLGRDGQADVLWGRTLGEHYRITGRLGRGGMAVVYDAIDQRDTTRVALKMMSHRLVYDEAARDQFQKEADIIESFDHPHISRMLGRFQEFHTFFTVMEFCDGWTLAEILGRCGSLPEDMSRSIVGQVAEALKYAHERGIIHRDVKPGNIMVRRDGTVLLMDFGLAKDVADTHPSLAETLVGTPRYMAPEQLIGNPVTETADIFSLGLVMWELLIGRPMLPALDWIGLLRIHTKWDLSRLDNLRRQTDLTTYRFLRSALSAEADQRDVDLDELIGWSTPLDISKIKDQLPK